MFVVLECCLVCSVRMLSGVCSVRILSGVCGVRILSGVCSLKYCLMCVV